MKMKAAVTKNPNEPYIIKEVELDKPQKEEILVKILAVGVCHTDEAGKSGVMPFSFPVILGHEGAGVVEEIGRSVTEFKPGDAVCLTFANCGKCNPCVEGRPYACERMNDINFSGVYEDGKKRINWDGNPVSSFFAQSSFAAYTVVNQRSAIKIDKDIDMGIAAPFGCGVQTGAGIVFNSLRPEFGSTLAVAGCGTVGLCSIIAAKICGCSKIIAVGGNEKSLELAKELGATHIINRKKVEDLTTVIKELCEFGVDYAIDTSGNQKMIFSLLHGLTYTGTLAIAGGGFQLTLGSFDLCARTIKGVTEGDSNPKIFIPKLLAYYKQGRFPIDCLIKYYPFEQINEATEDSANGKCIKAVLRLDT